MANSSNKLNLISDSNMIRGVRIIQSYLAKFAPYKKIRDRIRDSATVSQVTSSGVSKSVTLSIAMRGAPYARAFDIGSGIHGKLGQTYTIRPKNKNALWFPYPASKIYPGAIRYTKNGQLGITTLEVTHPGVKGTNYTREALKQGKHEVAMELGKDAIEGIKVYLKSSFGEVK